MAALFTLTNGSGEGDVSIQLDEFGASSCAIFDRGDIDEAEVFYQSGAFITQGNFLAPLGSVAAAEDRTATGVSQTATR